MAVKDDLDSNYKNGSVPGVEDRLAVLFAGFSCLTIVVFLLVTGILRIAYVYRDDKITELDARITSGPAAGLITSSEHKRQYEVLLRSIEKYSPGGASNIAEGDGFPSDRSGVLFTKILPWGYTASGMRVYAPDAWRHQISEERLAMYYDAHELPDIIFVLDAEVASYESAGDVEADPVPNGNDFSGELADIISSEYEEHIEEYCTVYVR